MTLAENKISDNISLPVMMIAAVAFIFPLVNVMYIFAPINLFGKNLWLVAPILIIVFLYFSTFVRFREFLAFRKQDISFLVIGGVALSIFVSRSLFYSEQNSLLDVRYIFTSIIFILVLKIFVKGEKNINFLYWILFFTCFIQAVIGLVHAYWFPGVTIDINSGDGKDLQIVFDGYATREGGTLGSSSYANVIVCGMFLLVARKFKSVSVFSMIALIFSMMLMFYAVTLSGSRYPIGVAGALAILFLSRFLSGGRQMLALLGVIFCAGLVFVVNFDDIQFMGIFRLDEDSGGRLEKLLLPLTLILESPYNFLIGVPSAIIANASSVNGVGISDNSYMLVTTQFGFVFMLFWFVFFIAQIKKNIVDKLSFFFVVYLLVGLGLTNCLLWEPWVFLAILTLVILAHGGLGQQPETQGGLGNLPEKKFCN